MRSPAVLTTAVVLGVALQAGLAAGVRAQEMTGVDQRFVGTWRLVSITSDAPSPNRGAVPTGLIYYDATGHMAVQIMPDRPRPSWSGSPTPEQALEAIRGYTAYFGTWTVDRAQGLVTHHREGSLAPGEVDFVRRFEFQGDRLILTPVNSSTRLIWERIR